MNLIEKAIAATKLAIETPTFDPTKIETRAFKNGTVAIRAILSDGQIVTFNEKTLERVVEEVDATTWRLKPGVTVATGSDGVKFLNPADAKAVSIWA